MSKFKFKAAVAKSGAMEADTISKNGGKLRSEIQGKRCFALLAFLFFTSLAFAQTNLQDVVYLKNGSIIRGMIIEQVPNQSVKIQIADMNIFSYRIDEIERITKEPAIHGQRNQQQRPAGYKYPALSWGLSFLVPGVGQFYNGDTGKGFIFLGGAVVGSTIFNIGAIGGVDWATATGLILYGGSWIWAQIDAPISAGNKNRARGFLSWDIGSNDAFLSLQPEFNFTPISSYQVAPTYGLGLKLKF